jgi:hypothetical protein
MYQDASYAVLPATDAGFAEPGATAPRQHPIGLTWRHAATGVLLLVALPVFAVAAVACLPVLLMVAAAQSLRRVWALAHQDQPAHPAAPRPSR